MKDITQKPKLAFWCEQITAYEREASKWETRSKKIVKRYKDTRGDTDKGLARFNILWSNVQTLHPAIYANPPKPNIDRRFQDDDDAGNVAAQVLERSTAYFVQKDIFDDAMNQAVLDRLLSGRGTMWIRYSPNFQDENVQGTQEIQHEGAQVTDDIVTGEETTPELYSEDAIPDYVHWQDFGHTVARTWNECRAIWRRVYLDRKELEARFPNTAFKDGACIVPMDAKDISKTDGEEKSSDGKKACIYELWDKVTKKAYWFHKNMEDFLDERDDPLRLEGFFPCPRPLFATLANDSLIPTPDFVLYQDQAIELDTLTQRIDALTRALKIVGVYDSSAEGVQRMLSENVDNKLIPVEQWAVFAEKGGIKGVVDFFPTEMVANVLIQLYGARDKIKQDIYEITGISDIVRGATNANETATAQQIKGQFATLRLDNMQKEVARFSRDAVRIIAEIIAEHFSVETLKAISGIKLLDDAEKQQLLMLAQSGQPLDEKMQELLAKPTWQEVEAIIREDAGRCFRIDIETDSTIKADQDAEKQARVEFLSAAGGFIQQATQVQNPELQPLLMEMLMFGIRGFKTGREMETTFKVAIDKMKKAAEQPQENPAAQAEAAKMGMEEQKLQIEVQRLQAELALKERELAIKERETAIKEQQLLIDAQIEEKRIDSDNFKARIDAKSKAPLDIAMTDSDMVQGESPLIQLLAQSQQQSAMQTDALLQLANAQQQGTAAIVAAVTQPKRVEVKRDKTGKMQSAEVING